MKRPTALEKRNEHFARRWQLAKARHKYAADRATLDRIQREMEAIRNKRAIRAAIRPLQLPIGEAAA